MSAKNFPLIFVGEANDFSALIQLAPEEWDVQLEPGLDTAWQCLVVNPAWQAVVIPSVFLREDQGEFIRSLRGSKIKRLREMPVFVWGEGVNESLSTRLLGFPNVFSFDTADLTRLVQEIHGALSIFSVPIPFPASSTGFHKVLPSRYLELRAAQAVAHAVRHGGDVSFMLLALDGREGLQASLGDDLLCELELRFAELLAGKMRCEDTLGYHAHGGFGIVAPATSITLCRSFAERVRAAVEVARVAIRGKIIPVTVSIGVASFAADKLESAAALFSIAAERRQQAVLQGGNCLDCGQPAENSKKIMAIQHALDLIKTGKADGVRPVLPQLIEQIIPLLRLCEDEAREIGANRADFFYYWAKQNNSPD